MLRKSLVLEIKKTQTNKTFVAPKHNFRHILVSFEAISLKWCSSFNPFNLIKQKAWFKMFSQFIRNQTYIFFHSCTSPMLYIISFSITDLGWLFHNRLVKRSCFVDFHFLIYRSHGSIDYQKKTLTKLQSFFQKLV